MSGRWNEPEVSRFKSCKKGRRILEPNAVVGVDLDYEVLGQGNGMMMVSASGTAVVVE